MRTLTAGLLTIILLASPALAEPSFTLNCNAKPRNLNLYRQALKDRILATIDPAVYTRVRVTVRFKLLSLETQPAVIPANTITSGISLIPQTTPAGLAYSIEGTASLDNECVYNYMVTISNKGTEVSTGNRLSAKTTSSLVIRGPMDGKFRRVAAPEATPTATPTSTPSQDS